MFFFFLLFFSTIFPLFLVLKLYHSFLHFVRRSLSEIRVTGEKERNENVLANVETLRETRWIMRVAPRKNRSFEFRWRTTWINEFWIECSSFSYPCLSFFFFFRGREGLFDRGIRTAQTLAEKLPWRPRFRHLPGYLFPARNYSAVTRLPREWKVTKGHRIVSLKPLLELK